MTLHAHGLTITFEPDAGGSYELAAPTTHDMMGPVDAQRDSQTEDFRPVHGEARAIDRGGVMWTVSFATAQRFDSFAEAVAEWAQQIETGLDGAGAGTLTIHASAAGADSGAIFEGAVCQRFRPRIDAEFPEVLIVEYAFRCGKGAIA